jgi:hypothetical protein
MSLTHTESVFVNCTDVAVFDIAGEVNSALSELLLSAPDDARNLSHTITPVVTKQVLGSVGDRTITQDVSGFLLTVVWQA